MRISCSTPARRSLAPTTLRRAFRNRTDHALRHPHGPRANHTYSTPSGEREAFRVVWPRGRPWRPAPFRDTEGYLKWRGSLHVFLSYHTPDREVARGLADRLAGHDPTLDVFFDRYDLRAGAFWIPALADAIGGADAVIVLLGARSPGPWQRLEYFEALNRKAKEPGFPIVPLVLPGAGPRLPFLYQLHQLPLADPAATDVLDALTAALRGRTPFRAISTTDQQAGFDAQLRDLEAAGCEKVFQEQLSSVAANRPELAACLDYMREGDTLVITRLDRLARSITHLLEIVALAERKRVALRILSLGVDTGTASGRLILTVLGAIAEFERSLMLERQKEGIAKAKADGRYKGRAPTVRRQIEAIRALAAEGMSKVEIARRLKVHRTSVYRALLDHQPAAPSSVISPSEAAASTANSLAGF